MHEDTKDALNYEKRIVVGPLPSEKMSYQFENLASVCLYEVHLQLKVGNFRIFSQL